HPLLLRGAPERPAVDQGSRDQEGADAVRPVRREDSGVGEGKAAQPDDGAEIEVESGRSERLRFAVGRGRSQIGPRTLMDALERTMGATAWLGSIGALGGVALFVISASLFSRLRRLLEPDRPSSRAPDDRRTAALEMIASLAAAVGLLGTFLALKADGGRLVPIFGPALAGLVVFVFCQGALGLLRSWSEPVPPTPLPAPAPPERTGPLPPPFSQAIGGDPWPTEATRPPDGL